MIEQQAINTIGGIPKSIDEQEFLRLTAQVAANAEVNLEFELRSERIKPFRVDITKPAPTVSPLLSIDGEPVFTRGNISAIVGESKSKKTFLTTALIASAMAYPCRDSEAFSNVTKDPSLTTLWIDTEQGEMHVRKVIDRINHITAAIRISGDEEDCRLNVFALREQDPRQRRETLRDAIYTYTPDLVVIDGIADLQYNTNDLEESDGLVGELMALSTRFNCHIVNVLHTNPGSDKARGHLGSALQRKCETVIYVHKDGETSIVEPQFCRNAPFNRFAFTITTTGIPMLCALPQQTSDKDDQVVKILNDHFGGSCERKVLSHKLEQALGLSRNNASMRIKRAIDRGSLSIKGDIVSLPVAQPVVAVNTTVQPAVVQLPIDYDECPF